MSTSPGSGHCCRIVGRHLEIGTVTVLFILACCLLLASCAEERRQPPKPARANDVGDREILRSLSTAGRLQESMQEEKDDTAMKMDHAKDRIRRLADDLDTSRREASETLQELERTRQQSAIMARRLEAVEATSQQLSTQLQKSQTAHRDAQALLEEWVVYAQALESQEQLYNDYIESQNQVINEMAARKGASAPGQVATPRVPDRLIPNKSRAVSRAKFFSIVQGMTLAELRSYLGSPDSIKGNPAEEYVYNRSLTYAYDENRKDSSIRVVIENGTVATCLFSE